MARRSRKPRSAPGAGARPSGADSEPRAGAKPGAGPSRTELRNAELRAKLEPLADDERPAVITIASLVAAALAILVIVGYLTGARIGGRGTLGGALVLTAILLVAAGGMWRVRYWAVLGFEALLAFQVIIAALSLLVASNLWAAALCLVVIGLGGWLFWKLIRVMARIQMPERRVPR